MRAAQKTQDLFMPTWNSYWLGMVYFQSTIGLWERPIDHMDPPGMKSARVCVESKSSSCPGRQTVPLAAGGFFLGWGGVVGWMVGSEPGFLFEDNLAIFELDDDSVVVGFPEIVFGMCGVFR